MDIKNAPYDRPLVEPGQELYRWYLSHVLKRKMIQYDYRTEEGTLFSCVGPSLEACREKRDRWMTTQTKQGETK